MRIVVLIFCWFWFFFTDELETLSSFEFWWSDNEMRLSQKVKTVQASFKTQSFKLIQQQQSETNHLMYYNLCNAIIVPRDVSLILTCKMLIVKIVVWRSLGSYSLTLETLFRIPQILVCKDQDPQFYCKNNILNIANEFQYIVWNFERFKVLYFF